MLAQALVAMVRMQPASSVSSPYLTAGFGDDVVALEDTVREVGLAQVLPGVLA